MERLRLRITDGVMKQLYKNQEKELLRKVHENAEYSAAALAFARAEIYAVVGEHQVKREWLEKILSSNP
jgi:dephospho-CoA kinase